MTLECPRGSKLAQLMAHHVFGHRHFHVLATIVNHERDIHELGNNRAGTGPRLDWFVTTRLRLFLHFEKQLRIDEWAFLATSAHGYSIASYGFLRQSDHQVIIEN